MLFCAIMCCAVLYCAVLCCIVLYCTVLYYAILYCACCAAGTMWLRVSGSTLRRHGDWSLNREECSWWRNISLRSEVNCSCTLTALVRQRLGVSLPPYPASPCFECHSSYCNQFNTCTGSQLYIRTYIHVRIRMYTYVKTQL